MNDQTCTTVSTKYLIAIYSIYTDYESDYRGKYTAIIGMKVNSLDSIPEGLVGRVFEGGEYVKFIAKGEMPDAVADTWRKIWSKDQELNRSYTADFEVHRAKFQNRKDAEVKVYIATNKNF